jgi:DNA-binding MarR family transcriptional regulator
MARPTLVQSAGERATVVDQANRLYLALARTGRSLRTTSEAPIGPGAFSTLWTITGQGPSRLTELAATEGVTRPTMTRIIDALEQRGYVTRKPDPDDGRAHLVAATRRGRALIAEGRAVRVKALALRLETLPAEHAARIDQTIAILEALARPAANCPP